MATEGILVWSIRGLNTRSHHDSLRELVKAERLSLMCIQESKLDDVSGYDIMQMFGPGFDYSFLPADHTRGGIIVAWRSSVWSLSSVSTRTYSLSANVLQVATGVA
jgi:exonuclease III